MRDNRELQSWWAIPPAAVAMGPPAHGRTPQSSVPMVLTCLRRLGARLPADPDTDAPAGQIFAEPSFSSAHVAARLGLSERYMQDLLQETGRAFSQRVLELRLQKARTMLADRAYDGLKIGDLAYACGFNEVPYFNRCFRRRFGASPTQFRGAEREI